MEDSSHANGAARVADLLYPHFGERIMRMSSTVYLSLVAIALAGCGVGESPAPVSSSAALPSTVTINDVYASKNSETPDDAPLDSSLVTLQLPGMT